VWWFLVSSGRAEPASAITHWFYSVILGFVVPIHISIPQITEEKEREEGKVMRDTGGTNLNPVRSTGDQRWPRGGPETVGAYMLDDFDDLDGTEKAGVGAELNRCRALAAKIANELRNKRPEHFVETSLLADIYYSLEHIADVLSTVNGSQAKHPQRHNC
jgi:hypothetical protein